jgi:hypothetical protein
VAGIASLLEAAYSYNDLSQPPRIVSVAPLVGPTAGGTRVTITGEAFSDSAVVQFVERNASGALTGNRSECVWRGVPGMGCNSTVITCLSPPLVTAGLLFDVTVTVSGSFTVFSATNPLLPSAWAYEAPVITAIAPFELPPHPFPEAMVTISGRSFGALRGAVIAGFRALDCPVWTDVAIVCVQPPGVAADVNVTVTAASGLVSAQAGDGMRLMFYPPMVVAVEPAVVLSSTAGGGRLIVRGGFFSTPWPVSVWLVRKRGSGALPLGWNSGGPVPSRDSLECPLVPGTATSTSLVCSVPPGAGVGWGLVVVNHDSSDGTTMHPGAMEAASTLRWRASTVAPNFSLAYAPPVLTSVRLESVGDGAPAVGGFSLLLAGANFGPLAPLVTVGLLPCTVLPFTNSHEALACTAPPRQLDSDTSVTVTVDGQSSGALPVLYDPPRLTGVTPDDVLALAPAGRPQITLRGVNFGARYRAGLPTPHVIAVGPMPCVNVVWVDDRELSCAPEGEVVVGPVPVTVTVAGNTSSPVIVMARCPVNTYGMPGDRCTPCPAGAQCAGGLSLPVSLPGHFPLAAAVFVPCVPRAACTGGISGTDVAYRSSQNNTGCSRLYRGDRCAECAVGAYRVKARCARCPGNAWLLFFAFALVITGAVAAAVYLSGKRINLAGLSIGVVSAVWLLFGTWLCPVVARATWGGPTLGGGLHFAFPSWCIAHLRPLICDLFSRLVLLTLFACFCAGLCSSAVHVCEAWF